MVDSDSSRCRRHPNQRQVPGVCSSCLREKLAKLDASSSTYDRRPTNFIMSYSSSHSSSPPYSTASSSSTTATITNRKSPGTTTTHRRNGSEAYVSVGMVLNNGLKKSRSVSCAPLSKSKLGANMDCIISNNEKNISGKNKTNINKDCGSGQILEEGSLRKKSGFLKRIINSTSKKTKGVLSHSKTMKERSHA